MRIEQDIKLDFDDVLIRPKRSTLESRKDVDLYRQYTFKNVIDRKAYFGIPIMASNMEGVGTIDMVKSLAPEGVFTCLSKYISYESLRQWTLSWYLLPRQWALSIGIKDSDFDLFKTFYDSNLHNIHFVCIDVANGYTVRFLDFVKKFREAFPYVVIIAGNVVTGEMTEELLLSGADIVKVGIGPGSVCTTRLKTGVGYPQLSAIIECADAAHGLRGHIIADGGCRSSGDIAKAFGAGADFVMLGGMLAGHKEGGEITESIKFSGSSSRDVMEKYHGEKAKYRAEEGKTVTISYRGEVKNTIEDILGGLRSACTYVGAASLKDMSKCTTFVRVTNTHNKIFGDR